MGINGGIWNTNGSTSINRGGHATCIVGYDDRIQMFKVQNQWGNFWGDNGYYWVTYNLVRNNCYEGLYIVYGNNGSTTLDITGTASICSPTITSNYTVNNLPCNSSVSWSSNIPQVTFSPQTGNPTTLNTNGYTGPAILTATIINSSGSTPIIKPIDVGTVAYFGGTFTNAFNGSINPLGYYPFVTNPACTGYYITTNITGNGSAYWTKVSSSNVVSWSQNGNNIQFYLFGANQWVIFQITYTTPCGAITKQFKWLSSNCSTGGGGGCSAFTVSPNPTTGKINIEVPNITAPCFASTPSGDLNSKQKSDKLEIAMINIYNLQGTKIKQFKFNATKQSSIDLTGLINGNYYLETISTSGYTEKKLIIIQNK